MIAAEARRRADENVRRFNEEGYLILRGLFSPDEAAEIRETFMAQAAEGPVEGLSDIRRFLGPDDPLAFYPRMMHPHRHPDKPVGPLALRRMLDPRLNAVLRGLFDDTPIAAQSMFYFKPPAARGQDFHQDNFYLRVRPGTCIAMWLAIDDADRDNGGMVVIPGSHLMDIVCPERSDPDRFFTTEHIPLPPGMREQPVDLTAGDVLFFNGSLIHGSYPNTSRDRFRRAFICHYIPEGCVEVSQGYRPLLTFDGAVVSRDPASGGGPCGTVHEPASPH